MPVPPKKLKALVDRDSKPPKMHGKGHDDDHDEEHEHKKGKGHDEEPEHEGGDEEGHDEVDVQAIGKRIKSGDGDEHLIELVEGMDHEDPDAEPPPEVEDHDLWKKAVKAVEPHWGDYKRPFEVVIHVYEHMDGKIDAEHEHGEDHEHEDEHEDDDEEDHEHEGNPY